MQLLNIILPFLLAGLASAQAQCFDDLDCLLSGVQNAKCTKGAATDLLGYETPPFFADSWSPVFSLVSFTPEVLENLLTFSTTNRLPEPAKRLHEQRCLLME
ncbi:hypothetical protein PspLS_11971 [Pyricularia sp. CBS 133598]|nr:hypothetical protein PspLS_11971 [Pyricularia sp. CBS 133598]